MDLNTKCSTFNRCRHGGAQNEGTHGYSSSKFNGEHSIMSTTAEAERVSVGICRRRLVVVGLPHLRRLSNAHGPKKNYSCPAPQLATALPSPRPRIIPFPNNNNCSEKHHQSSLSLVKLTESYSQQPTPENQSNPIPIRLSLCPSARSMSQIVD